VRVVWVFFFLEKSSLKKPTKYDEHTLTTTKYSQGYEHSSILEEHRQTNGDWKEKEGIKNKSQLTEAGQEISRSL